MVIRKKCKFNKNKLFSLILYVLFYKVNKLVYQGTNYLDSSKSFNKVFLYNLVDQMEKYRLGIVLLHVFISG